MLQHCETRAGVQEDVRSADNLIGSSEPRPEIVSGQNDSDYELNLSQFLLFMNFICYLFGAIILILFLYIRVGE